MYMLDGTLLIDAVDPADCLFKLSKYFLELSQKDFTKGVYSEAMDPELCHIYPYYQIRNFPDWDKEKLERFIAEHSRPEGTSEAGWDFTDDQET